jgi:hypothetical protein
MTEAELHTWLADPGNLERVRACISHALDNPESLRAALEQLYAEREALQAQVERLQAELVRLQAGRT